MKTKSILDAEKEVHDIFKELKQVPEEIRECLSMEDLNAIAYASYSLHLRHLEDSQRTIVEEEIHLLRALRVLGFFKYILENHSDSLFYLTELFSKEIEQMERTQ